MNNIENPKEVIVYRSWYSDNNERIKTCREIYKFDYSEKEPGRWACDYEKFIKHSDRHYYENEGPYGIWERDFEKFIKNLLSLNGKKRKRKNGYTQYKVYTK